MYSGREGSPTPTITPTFPWLPVEQEIFVNLSGGFVQGIWDHVSSPESASTLMASYDGYERSDRLEISAAHSISISIGAMHWAADITWCGEPVIGGLPRSRVDRFVYL